MRRKQKKPDENSIESIAIEEPMPDDAVLPSEQETVTETPPAAPAIAATGVEAEGAAARDEPLARLQRELEEHRRRAADSLDQFLRARAELDNMRKRAARDIESAHKYALERFVAELLPVMDSMEMGIAASTGVDDIASLKEGMELTLRMLLATLEKFGVKTIDPLGEKFNPERHEAVSMQREEGTEPGMVINVMQKGYELNGRLVRPAMVVVSG